MQTKPARKKVIRLPRKQKKIFVIVKGANEYHYQRLLLADKQRFGFMGWKEFEKITKQQYKYHLSCERKK